jgi:hypothetical protein
MNDADIREGLKRKVLRHHLENQNTLVLDEVGLRHGAARIDVLVVNGYLHGYELKSDSDTLRRLDNQIRVYCSVLDKVTMVVGDKHLDEVESAVPDWWGIKVATQGRRGGITFPDVRRSRMNPALDPVAVAKLLWRDEALEYLAEIGCDVGVRSKPRRVVYMRLGESAALPLLRARVRDQLRGRTDWRSASLQTSDDG